MRKKLKHIAWLLGSVVSGTSVGQFGSPVSTCLNEHTIPLISTDKPAIEIVDAAYEQCQEVLIQWREERKSLPKEMVAKQDKEHHAFYVDMIEKRRNFMKKKK